MLLFIRTLAEKQIILILRDFYAVLVSQHWEQRSIFKSSSISSRRRWLSIRSATFHLSSDDKVFSALGTAVLVVAKCWSGVLSTPLACVPVARCNLSSQLVSGSWRLIYRLASSCTAQLLTSFIKAWTFIIFLGQAFQTWNIFKFAHRALKGAQLCLFYYRLSKQTFHRTRNIVLLSRNFHTWLLEDNSTAAY